MAFDGDATIMRHLFKIPFPFIEEFFASLISLRSTPSSLLHFYWE
jgi:hypothetical protein